MWTNPLRWRRATKASAARKSSKSIARAAGKYRIIDPAVHFMGRNIGQHHTPSGAQQVPHRAQHRVLVADMMQGILVRDDVKASCWERRVATVALHPENLLAFALSLREHPIGQIQSHETGL